MIVATAGHIDHGKTTLVKALTGTDTDRLPQEKARGISIDLGFAYWTSPCGAVVGFVDVPGHERFIHNMLAGLAGIDFALLVVAADDGVMPQTREHLHILDLFCVPAGLAVLTKTDRVTPERVAQVGAEVGGLLAGTSLKGSPVMAVSAVSGAGVPEVLAGLAQAAMACGSHHRTGRSFRLAIDRSFSVHGSGTVVTGTVLDGEVAAGDRLFVSPEGLSVRVRALHKRGEAAGLAVAGERCALNIIGAHPDQAGRGMWLVAPNAHAPTQRLDARVRLLPTKNRALKHWDPVHVHIGTADLLARVVTPGTVVAPGGSALVQLALQRPVSAALGDRFVLRDASAQHTLGGGSVIDPFAVHPRGQREARACRLEALQEPDAHAAWTRLLHQSAAGVAVQPFRRAFNLTPGAMRELLESSQAHVPGGEQGSAFSATHLQAIESKLLATLREFHAASPHVAGMDTDRLLKAALPGLAQRERAALLRAMAHTARVETKGSLVCLPGHTPVMRAGHERLWKQLQPLYAAWGPRVPLLREVAARSGIEEAELRKLLRQQSVAGEVIHVARDRFLLRSAVAQLADAVVRLSRERERGEFTIADYRDQAGIGRNLAIEVLEYFDRLGLTQREGDARAIRCLDENLAAAMKEPNWRPDRFTVGDERV